MLNFSVICTKDNLDGNFCCNYGIEIISNDTVIRRVEDITFSKEKITVFADACNRCQISPIHFDDVLENFLSDFKSL